MRYLWLHDKTTSRKFFNCYIKEHVPTPYSKPETNYEDANKQHYQGTLLIFSVIDKKNEYCMRDNLVIVLIYAVTKYNTNRHSYFKRQYQIATYNSQTMSNITCAV